jgi:hypothetical protein
MAPSENFNTSDGALSLQDGLRMAKEKLAAAEARVEKMAEEPKKATEQVNSRLKKVEEKIKKATDREAEALRQDAIVLDRIAKHCELEGTRTSLQSASNPNGNSRLSKRRLSSAPCVASIHAGRCVLNSLTIS